MQEEIIKQVFDALNKLKTNTDPKHDRIFVKINSNKRFSIEALRLKMPEESPEKTASIVAFSIYYQVKREDVDCYTISTHLDHETMHGLNEYLEMYV